MTHDSFQFRRVTTAPLLPAQDKEGLPLTCRAVFIIGPDKKLKLSLNYPASVGRNMDGAPEPALGQAITELRICKSASGLEYMGVG